MERERKPKKKIIIETVISKKKNPRTGKYYEKEVEVEAGTKKTLDPNSNAHYRPRSDWGEWTLDDLKEVRNEPKTLQEYLNEKYPTKESKEKIEDIDLTVINKERNGLELLEGGELCLRGYSNLLWVNLDGELLKTPLVKISLEGLGDKFRGCYMLNNAFSFSEIKTLWDKGFLLYEDYDIQVDGNGYPTFPLISAEEITNLAYQLNETNWKDLDFIKQFGIDETDLDYLKEDPELVYVLLDNLANQIIARCVIVANRLTHGENKKDEEYIMKLALDYQNCNNIPEPKETNKQLLKGLVNKALNKDEEMLSKLQNLPWQTKQTELIAKIETLELKK